MDVVFRPKPSNDNGGRVDFMLFIGCCVRYVWYCEFNGCLNVTSAVTHSFQMNLVSVVCVVTSDAGLFIVL